MPNNPNWTRDEVILALDLYFQNGRKALSPKHPEVVALSEFLQSLPAHPLEIRDEKFRNPSGVAMKISNLMSHDPTQASSLPSSSRTDKAVWDEFCQQPERLHLIAQGIRESAAVISSPTLDEDNEGFAEGRILERLHKRRERNQTLVQKKLRQTLQQTGRLACEVCGFDFAQVYGELGKGFAECHHTLPLASAGERETRLQDLAVVCANCHRMIHRAKPMPTTVELREKIRCI